MQYGKYNVIYFQATPILKFTNIRNDYNFDPFTKIMMLFISAKYLKIHVRINEVNVNSLQISFMNH